MWKVVGEVFGSGGWLGAVSRALRRGLNSDRGTRRVIRDLGPCQPLGSHQATGRAVPLPRRFLSLSQPLPPHVGDVKIPRKSRVVAPQAEAWFRRRVVPSRGRPGEGPGPRTPPSRSPHPTPPQLLLANSLSKSKSVSRAIFGRVRRVLKLNQTGRRGSLGLFFFFFFFQRRGTRWVSQLQALASEPTPSSCNAPKTLPGSTLKPTRGSLECTRLVTVLIRSAVGDRPLGLGVGPSSSGTLHPLFQALHIPTLPHHHLLTF